MVRTVVARRTTHETSFESRQEIIDNHQVLGAMDEKWSKQKINKNSAIHIASV